MAASLTPCFSNLEFATWIGVFGPPGMARDVIAKVFDTLREGLDGFEAFYTTPRFWNVWQSKPKGR